ncbi:hypothetical protein H6G89_29540 [Oscillatoria sp. FACHB-1407]|uniref:hypothetical protein n=1 Tax=Oscillatoria sp. FACHB-1407 TaxID=2692847 RepID=UPI001687B26B|nr:hypothetical protein [Oscillatoria sp. FACHB-1407]MBD2465155.1 hypothetical protein [Oscillatoria sp. FACHB-1407]
MDTTTVERLRPILECAATVPGYRDRFQSAGLLRENAASDGSLLVANWQQAFLNLQPLDRATVRNQPGAFLANATDVVYRGVTSGTQGRSLIYFAGEEWNAARLQSRQRFLAWWGITDEIPILNVASRLFPLRPMDGALIGTLTPPFIYQLLDQLAIRPTALRGYPSRLCEVAVQLRRTRLPPVVAVICTGERLYGQQRSLLEQVFCAPVVDEYGCQETGISGLTCPEGGRLHLDNTRCLYEVVNGQLLTTDLLNQVMPMVRYDCGDRLVIDPEPCSCGRPGLTATVLGRVEDTIHTSTGAQLAGAISMPAFDGICQYRVVQRDDSHLTLFVQPQHESYQLDNLVNWVQATFGEVAAQVIIEKPPLLNAEPIPECDELTWIQAITQGSWAQWMKQPAIPTGSAQGLAELWRELVNPPVIVNQGVSPTAGRLLQQVIDSAADTDSTIEWIKVRLLLFACSVLSTSGTAVYQQAIARLHTLLQRQTLSQQQQALLHLDRLIPSLYLPNGAEIWAEPLPSFTPLDTFAVHHLLQALESAAQMAIAQGRLPRLRPLLSVLIGDFQFFAPQFGVWLLAYWFAWLREQPVPGEVPAPTDPFAQAWLDWRHLPAHPTDGERLRLAALSVLEATVRSPLEQTRVVIERGYAQLLQQQPLDPETWLPQVQSHVGKMSERPANLTAWAPILKALARSLMSANQRALAYQCLVAATTPTSKGSAFERLAAGVNGKQVILGCKSGQ